MKSKNPQKIRITWNGALLREVYPFATKWEVMKFRVRNFCRKATIVIGAILLLVGCSYAAFFIGTNYARASMIVIHPAAPQYPVLDRIAQCESGSNQYDKNGQVLMHWNKNGTVDVGKYAINETLWGKQATSLGLDLTKQSDNYAMAIWIYTNRGTGDWVDSSKCWEN